MNINDLIEHYRVRRRLSSTLSDDTEDKLRHISRVFGNMKADSDGSAFLLAGKAAWQHASPGTLKRYIVQLRAVLRRAERDGVIARAPLIDTPFVHDTVYVDISVAELTRLLDYIEWTEPQWYPLVLVLSHTGARLGEALGLTERSFTSHGTRIAKPVGRKSKTVERTIPYTPRLQEAIRTGLVAAGRLTPRGLSDESVSSCLGRVLDVSTEALGIGRLRVHDLRHAFAAVIAERGGDLADISTALGHSTPAMAMRYRGLVKGRLNGILSGV